MILHLPSDDDADREYGRGASGDRTDEPQAFALGEAPEAVWRTRRAVLRAPRERATFPARCRAPATSS